jgi:1-acyl-sn-glycerol-3-phosphate acyltransferase
MTIYTLRARMPLPAWVAYRGIRTVLVASAFVFFWTGGTLLAWLVLPIVALVARDRRRACQRLVAQSWRLFHGYMRVLRLLEVRVVGGLPAYLADQRVVFVANHATLVDVTAITSRMPELCVVAKHVYASSRFVGRLLSLMGFIDAGTTVAERAAAVDEGVRRIEEGFHVLVFPEGQRSTDGSLGQFQRGAFEIACRAGVPVVPIVMRCRPPALRRGQRFWAQPDERALLTIELGEPVQPASFEHKSRRMKKAVEARYRSILGLNLE